MKRDKLIHKFAIISTSGSGYYTLKIAVYYGNVANLTFISDFELMIEGTLHPVKNLITLLFVKTKGEWKMVHEHHSPAN
ncbi:nuclear transport factor 2 family protein [Pseudomonadota bacterium]